MRTRLRDALHDREAAFRSTSNWEQPLILRLALFLDAAGDADMLHRRHTPGFILPAQPVQSDMVGGAKGSIAPSCLVARWAISPRPMLAGKCKRRLGAICGPSISGPASFPPAKIVLSGDGNLRAWAKLANVARLQQSRNILLTNTVIPKICHEPI